jgi:hypothetical protein
MAKSPSRVDREVTMPAPKRRPRLVRPDDTLTLVLSNGDDEIERGTADSGYTALGVALMMLARRGELRAGDVLNVLAPS